MDQSNVVNNQKENTFAQVKPAPDATYRGRQYQRVDTRRLNQPSCQKIFFDTLVELGGICLEILVFPINYFLSKPQAMREVPPSSTTQNSLKSCERKDASELSALTATKTREQILSEQHLGEGIEITEEIISKIQMQIPHILEREEDGAIKFYKSQASHRVFELAAVPGFIFKMKPRGGDWELGNYARDRFQTMVEAQTVIRQHHLDLLVIPHAKIFVVNFEGKKYEVLAEQKMDIDLYDSTQEQAFQDNAETLDEAVRQLAIFICKTGYSDVEWRNNPVLKNHMDPNGNRKIVLADIEEMHDVETGLFGGRGRRGLVRCVTENQGQIVAQVAKEQGIPSSSFAKVYAMRKREIAEKQELERYHAEKHIRGDELIELHENRVDFSEHPGKEDQLRQITRDVVQAINDQIKKSSSQESLQARRHTSINTRHEPFSWLDTKLIAEHLTEDAFKTKEEYFNATYLGCVVNKLVSLGVIHSATPTARGCNLQA